VAIAEIDYGGFAETFEAIAANVQRIIEGKAGIVRLALIALAAEGHLLVEDVPGVGKTMLAKAIARSISCEWRRLQFTPDLLPSDVTGVGIYDAEVKRFVFKPGPIFANIVLGDEINRASPKTQSALLEAMEEQQVTVDNRTYKLPAPFIVIATQNPIEHAGTYPLPESELDRFLMRIHMGYPDRESELEILDTHGARDPVARLEPVASGWDVLEMMAVARSVFVAPGLKGYLVDLAEATRSHPGVGMGMSPRATLHLLRAARARAAAEGRSYLLPDDVKALAHPVLDHRLSVALEGQAPGAASEALSEILERLPVPRTARE